MSTLDHKLEPETTTVRRPEVITGTGRRRQFTEDFKARVIEETLAPGAVVSEVARLHDLTPQQVFFLTFHVRDHGVCIPWKLLLLRSCRSSAPRNVAQRLSA